MEARITRLDAEKAIREGVESAKLRKEVSQVEKERDALAKENAHLKAMLAADRSIIRRHNRVLALKYEGMRAGREYERKEMRGNVIDAFIVGVGLGALLAIGIASWVVYLA